VFAPDCFTTPTPTVGWPLNRASVRSFSTPPSTTPTSPRRTGEPSRQATMSSLKPSGVWNSPSVRTVNSRLSLSSRPEGISTLPSWSARRTSATVIS